MFETLVGAIGTTLDGLSALILAVTLGFAAFPTALGHLTAIAGMILTGQFVPLSSPSEVTVLVVSLSEKREERQSIIFYSGCIIFLLGITGAIGAVVDFVGVDILSAMMAGVAIMLTRVSADMIKKNKLAGLCSLGVSVLVYLFTRNLVYTVTLAVVITTIVWNLYQRRQKNEVSAAIPDLENERFHLTRPTFHPSMIRGVLAVLTLQLGGSISNVEILASLANKPTNMNSISGYMGVGNMLSGLFGGAPMGVIIAGTSTTPKPQMAAILFMVLLAALSLLRIVPRIIPYIPSQGIAGFLMVLSIFVIFPDNASAALNGNPLVASITMLVTALVDPFFGMCAGVLARLLLGLFGM